MTLAAGTKLGPYEILSPIGAGGMGEVYRARDTRLGREVAVKVLPPEFATDGDRLARFEREAQAVAALSHPGILAVHDIGREGEVSFLVTELLEGESLRDRLAGGPLSPRKAASLASQVARGLAAAHERGIVHRDLKPENVFITRDGHVKILDFGLAKIQPGTAGQELLSQLPTASRNTGAGVVLGTVGYMSPEQVRGEAVDHRTDIFSFGCILYEMLTGQMAFRASSAVEIMHAILTEEPRDLSLVREEVPPHLALAVRHCLEKKPDERFQSARDLAFQLDAVSLPSVSGARAAPSGEVAGPAKVLRYVPALVAAVALLALIIAFSVLKRPPPAGLTGPVYLDLVVPDSTPVYLGYTERELCLSPDGRRLVFTSQSGDSSVLCWRSLDSPEVHRIPGTENARVPTLSPDGKWLTFYTSSDPEIRKIPFEGGAPVTLAKETGAGPVVWDASGRLFFSTMGEAFGAPQGTPHWMPAGGGTVKNLGPPDKSRKERRLNVTCVLPGGKHLLVTARDYEGDNVDLYTLEDGSRRQLLRGANSARYLTTGHILYVSPPNHRALMAVPFDLRGLELKGPPRVVLEGVAWGVQFDVSPNGNLVYIPKETSAARNALILADRTGAERTLVTTDGELVFPRFSPDGRRLAVERAETEELGLKLWMYDMERNVFTRLFSEPKAPSPVVLEACPVWNPNGDRLMFTRLLMDFTTSFQSAVPATAELTALGKGEYLDAPQDFSRDGSLLVFMRQNGLSEPFQNDLWLLPVDGQPPRPFLQTKYAEAGARISPDGRWIAYHSDESGRYEVYVQSFPKPGDKRQVSKEGGTFPVWSRQGKELFFLKDKEVFAVPVTAGASLGVGEPRKLFEGDFIPSLEETMWDAAPDGQHFVFIRNVKPPPTRFAVVLGWFDEVRGKVPRGK